MRIMKQCQTCRGKGFIISEEPKWSHSLIREAFLVCTDCDGCGAVTEENILCMDCLSSDIDNLGDGVVSICSCCNVYFLPFGIDNEDEGKIDKFNKSKFSK